MHASKQIHTYHPSGPGDKQGELSPRDLFVVYYYLQLQAVPDPGTTTLFNHDIQKMMEKIIKL